MTRKVFFSLSILPLLFILLSVFKIIDSSGTYLYSGLQYDGVSRFFPGQPVFNLSHGQPTIDPCYGTLYEALGRRAALDVFSGKLPLWNHYEGLGTPLLGEMASAALFPPTWLLAFPHGQALELGLLQILAGLGAWLFLRKLGSATKSALVGAVLFQFNGVFVWLRNVVNPVAFLPWLFLVIEILHTSANDNARKAKRLPVIALGGVAAALAIYAGFPEVVYLYSLLLLVWAVFRFFALNRPARPEFLLDLGLVCLVGLLLSLPVLLAFVAFLPEAALGGHAHSGFYGVYLPPSALLHALLPYVYGPIFVAKNPLIHRIWSHTGGYIGLVPCILALTALFFPKRRAIKILTALWIVFAVGVTFGVPGIYQVFEVFPLAKITMPFRYLNSSWIFCFVILAGLALDDIRQAKISDVRRALGKAVALVVILLAVAVALAWPVLTQLRTEEHPGIMHTAVLSAGAALTIVLGTVFLATRAKPSRIAGMLGILLVAEALANFAVPYLYFPSHSKLDEGTIAFIKNIGYQRTVGSETASITPNYGSYFGFSYLNWRDLPVPKLSIDYVRNQLDPFIRYGLMYRAGSDGLTMGQRAQRKILFRQRLDRYAQAGVKYITSRTQPATLPFMPELQNDLVPLALGQSRHLEMTAPFTQEEKTSLTGCSVLIGTYGGTSDGKLTATICNADECAQGAGDLATARDNAPLEITLDRPLSVAKGDAVRIVFEKQGGVHLVALWMATLAHPSEDIRVQTDGEGFRPGTVPSIEFRDQLSDKVRLVYKGVNFNLYELPGVKPYFEAEGCSLTAVSHDEVKASCADPSHLTRLELAMPGWKAYVNDTKVKIENIKEAFQQIALPKGDSTVRFVFMPTGMRLALIVASCTLAAVLFVLGYALVERFRPRKID